MINITPMDRQHLTGLLAELPEFATEPSRRQLVEYAGLQTLLPRIDLAGSPFLAANQLVSYLARYGRITYENEALGIFLNAIKGFTGAEQQELLDKLLLKYDMMTPVVPGRSLDRWRGQESPAAYFEKIIGENTLRPIAFLAQGLLAARAVAYVSVGAGATRWSGTGFLVAPNIAITNHHVIPDATLLPDVLFRLNYEEDFHGKAQQPDEYNADTAGVFHASEALDYAVVQLTGEPGKKWGCLPLLSRAVRTGDHVNIIQHPDGLPKQISLQNNLVEYVDEQLVQYVTSTKPGSSGSPVFNDNWEVVALHHAGGHLVEPETQRVHFRNEGVLISRVLNDLPAGILSQIQEAARNQCTEAMSKERREV